jgi:hypothetical protein
VETTAIIKRFEAQYNRYSVVVSKTIWEKGLSWFIEDTRRFVQPSFLPITIVRDMELREQYS